MTAKKKIIFTIACLKDGGSSRVASILLNYLANDGYEVEIIVTNTAEAEIQRALFDDGIRISSLEDKAGGQRLHLRLLRLPIRVCCRLFEALTGSCPSALARQSFLVEYAPRVDALAELLRRQPEATVISFLQPSIPITLLAAAKTPNRVIISERGDPIRLMRGRYGGAFLKKYYNRADVLVFQTEDAEGVYPRVLRGRREVISNPLKSNLPEPYTGERKKVVTTFCRIHAHKNLHMLTDAFAMFYPSHPEYRLRIIGDAPDDSGRRLLAELKARVAELNIDEAVDFLPFSPDVHELIIDDAMYVNSSDCEGMSNAMLEAMAIGLPSVCTDCPIGGARAVIRDRENGILVPVSDAAALAGAMAEIADSPSLAQKLSQNGAELRAELKIDSIAEKWKEIL